MKSYKHWDTFLSHCTSSSSVIGVTHVVGANRIVKGDLGTLGGVCDSVVVLSLCSFNIKPLSSKTAVTFKLHSTSNVANIWQLPNFQTDSQTTKALL